MILEENHSAPGHGGADAANQCPDPTTEVAGLLDVLADESFAKKIATITRQLESRCSNDVRALAYYLRPYASFCAGRKHAGLPASAESIFDYIVDCEREVDDFLNIGRRMAAVAIVHCLGSDRPTAQRRAYLDLPAILRSYLALPERLRAADIWGHWSQKLGTPDSAERIFSDIYSARTWGFSEEGDFYSGVGSHKPDIIAPYISAVRKFIGDLPVRSTGVDLGCGDFNVGKYLCGDFTRFVACDVVGDLIRQNINRYAELAVEFNHLDIIHDDLPDGDIAFIRQVLQHLSNEDIFRVIPKISRYNYVIVSEHVPYGNFTPNINKLTGYHVRADFGSGVVLTASPFSINCKSETILCETPERNGVIRTVAYSFR